MMASKCVYLVVCALNPDMRRYGEPQRKVEGITPKMLTQTFRILEYNGLVWREIFPVIRLCIE